MKTHMKRFTRGVAIPDRRGLSDFVLAPGVGGRTALPPRLQQPRLRAPITGAGAPPAATAPGSGPDIENPPLSGLDEPSSEPAFGGRSYLVPGLQLSESVNSITSGVNSNTSGTRRNRSRPGFRRPAEDLEEDLSSALDYVAGGTVLPRSHPPGPPRNMPIRPTVMALDQRFLWRTGQLAFRDSFSYLPEGSFGFGSFGGAGGFSSALGGGGANGGAGTGLGGGITGGIPGGGTLGGGTDRFRRDSAPHQQSLHRRSHPVLLAAQHRFAGGGLRLHRLP